MREFESADRSVNNPQRDHGITTSTPAAGLSACLMIDRIDFEVC